MNTVFRKFRANYLNDPTCTQLYEWLVTQRTSKYEELSLISVYIMFSWISSYEHAGLGFEPSVCDRLLSQYEPAGGSRPTLHCVSWPDLLLLPVCRFPGRGGRQPSSSRCFLLYFQSLKTKRSWSQVRLCGPRHMILLFTLFILIWVVFPSVLMCLFQFLPLTIKANRSNSDSPTVTTAHILPSHETFKKWLQYWALICVLTAQFAPLKHFVRRQHETRSPALFDDQ